MPAASDRTPASVSATKDTGVTTTETSKPTATTSERPAADNSAINERDRPGTSKTPIDQNENPEDIKITADIRKRVVSQADFSISAQNIKIITADRKVTLRGPVASEKERDAIAKIAAEIAGEDHVDNQIEIAP